MYQQALHAGQVLRPQKFGDVPTADAAIIGICLHMHLQVCIEQPATAA
jgi:hypothetical protein